MKDKHLKVIENQIKMKHDLLIKNKQHIDEKHKTNKHLGNVKSKYDQYYKVISEQNTKLLEMFHDLDDYILNTKPVSKKDEYNLKKEQTEIVKEIKNIQENINKLI
jgi:hypothetical protein